jgi:hypothetical protein
MEVGVAATYVGVTEGCGCGIPLTNAVMRSNERTANMTQGIVMRGDGNEKETGPQLIKTLHCPLNFRLSLMFWLAAKCQITQYQLRFG